MRDDLRAARLVPVVAAAIWMCGTAALADSEPVVRVVPQGRFPPVRAARGEPVNARLARQLPANEDFFLEIPFPGSHEVTGAVHVWPKVIQDQSEECQETPPLSGKQVYHFGLMRQGDKDDRVLRARIPKLQVAKDFCIRMEVKSTLDESELRDIATLASAHVLSMLLPSQPIDARPKGCPVIQDAPLFEHALGAALKEMEINESGAMAARIALGEFVAGQGPKHCGEMQGTAGTLQTLNQEQLPQMKARLAHQTAALRDETALPNLAPPGPPVVLGDKDVPQSLDHLLVTGSNEALQNAAGQLRTLYPSQPDVQKSLEPYAELLLSVARSPEEQRKDAIANARKALAQRPRPAVFALWIPSSKVFVELATLRADPERYPPGEVSASLRERKADFPAKERALVDKWIAAFTLVEKAQTALRTGQADAAQLQTKVNTAADSLKEALQAAFKAEKVSRALQVSLGPVGVGATSADGRTPAYANFASVDLGAALAFPSGGRDGEPWFLPYIGLNLYAVPVNREVPLGEMVGSTFFQRASLTLGFTLSTPTIPGRTIKAPFLGKLPLFAVGYRLTTYTRFVGGGIMYTITDANPAAGSERLVVAPFAGASLDADIVHLLTQFKP